MDGSFISEVEQLSMNPLDLFVSSIDTLRSLPIDQHVPRNSGWSARPSRASGIAASHEKEEIRALCRRGIPPCLRCAAWIINVFSADPNLPQSAADEYGTLAKVRVLDHGWSLVLQSMFPDESDLERADVLDFGVGGDHLVNILLRDHGGEIHHKGVRSLIVLLHGVRDSLGVEFCPLLPDISCLLLSFMPVSRSDVISLVDLLAFIFFLLTTWNARIVAGLLARRATLLQPFGKWSWMIRHTSWLFLESSI